MINATIKYTFENGKIFGRDVTSGNKQLSTVYCSDYFGKPFIQSNNLTIKDGERTFRVSEGYSDEQGKYMHTTIKEGDKPYLSHNRGYNLDLGTYEESVSRFIPNQNVEEILAASSNGRYIDPTRVRV